MSYAPQNFQSGQTLYAAQLNAMDGELKDVSDFTQGIREGDNVNGNSVQVLGGSLPEHVVKLQASLPILTQFNSEGVSEMSQSRAEQYFAYLAGQSPTYPDAPQSRIEQYLYYLCANNYGENLTPEQLETLREAVEGVRAATEQLSEIAESIENVAHKVRIDYYGNSVFKMGENTLNFEDIYNYHMVAPDFTFIVYNSRAYLCSYVNVPETGMKEMRFESVINSDSRTKVSSIYIVSNDGISIANTTVSDINSENSSNKVNAITEANKSNTNQYPSVKAVVDYSETAMTDVLSRYSAFINRRNIIENPLMISEYGAWIVDNRGQEQNTITYEATDKICQAMRVVSDGSAALSLVSLMRASDVPSNRYVISFDIPSGSVGSYRVYFIKANQQGQNAGALYTSASVRAIGRFYAEIDIDAADLTKEYCAVLISFTSASNCLITEPYFAVKSDYNDFYAKDIYRLPVPDVPYEKIQNVAVTPEETTFMERRHGTNLFNSADIHEGFYLDPTTHAPTTHAGSFYTYVKLPEAGTYTFKVNANTLGLSNSEKIPFYDTDLNFVKTIRAVGHDSLNTIEHIVSVTVSETDVQDGCAYIGYSQRISKIPMLMVVSGSEYPALYIPFMDGYIIPELANDSTPNPLKWKTVVFDGDSICAANSETTTSLNRGWPYRIGEKNGMGWANVGVGGGVITNGIPDKHCLCTYIDTIHDTYPQLDYFIFDGGTNDADNLNESPERYGVLTPDDFSGNYDDTTFIGAFETLVYKALNYYPNARIGWIIAQKMGASASEYDENGKRRKFFNMGIQVCKKWGIPYIDLWNGNPLNPMLNAYYDSSLDAQGNKDAGKCYIDGQHLTAMGYDRITPAIEAWMKTL